MFNHAQVGKIMSLLLPALAITVSAASVAGAGAEVTKVKKSEAVCFDDYPSPGYRVCWYGITIDSSRLSDSEEILNVKYLNTIEVYDGDGRLIDKETQVTVTNENAEMEVYETLIRVSPEGEVETCKTTIKDSRDEDLFIHNLGDCPETSGGVQSSATIVLQSDRQGLLGLGKGCATVSSLEPEQASSDNLIEPSLDESELVLVETSGQASSAEILKATAGGEAVRIYNCVDMAGSPVEDVAASEDFVYCDYGVEINHDTTVGSHETTIWNMKENFWREIYYDGVLLGRYNIFTRYNISGNSVSVFEATAQVTSGGDGIEYCTEKTTWANGEVRNYEYSCEIVLDLSGSAQVSTGPPSEPALFEAHKSTLFQQKDPELLEELVTALLKTYDSGLSEELDLDTFESLVTALLEEYETALVEQSQLSLLSQIDGVAGGDDVIRGPELEGSTGQEGAEVIIEKKTDTVCFDEDGNIVDDVKSSTGYVNCYYSKEHIVYLPTSSSVINNNQWTGKIEVYRDGKLVQKYDEAWKNHCGENVAVTWYAYFTINEVTGQLQYCTTMVVVQEDGQLFERTTCEEAEGVFLY